MHYFRVYRKLNVKIFGQNQSQQKLSHVPLSLGSFSMYLNKNMSQDERNYFNFEIHDEGISEN